MSKIIILFLSAILLSAAGSCDAAYKDWTREEQEKFNTFLALQVIDTAQTFDMINCQKHIPHCNLREINPILGSHPNKLEVVALKTGMNYIIFKALDRTEDRSTALTIFNGIFTVVITHNGVQLSRRF